MLLVVTDVNIKTELGFTPLHYSAKYLPRIFNENEATDVESATVNVTEISSVHVISLLLQHNANVNAQDNDGLTPLAIACQRGNYFAVERLLQEEKVDIAVKDNKRSTALHEACENGTGKIVELLLKRKANISVADRDGVTPLHIACHKGCSNVVKLLLHHNDDKKDIISAKDAQGNTPLHFAVESGVELVVQEFLSNGADPIAQKKNKVTPLHIAACHGHIVIATLLLQYKDQIGISEMIDSEQNTPLHFAAHHNQCKMIQHLVEK